MNVLHVDSSILGEASASRALSGEIVRRLRDSQADLQVTYVDLAAEPLPHYSAASLAVGGGTEGARDAALLAGFLHADVIVIGAPLYNFGLPSQLKAWVDRIVIQGKTFRYTAFVRAEGLNVSPESREQSLQGARASIQGLSPAAGAALAA